MALEHSAALRPALSSGQKGCVSRHGARWGWHPLHQPWFNSGFGGGEDPQTGGQVTSFGGLRKAARPQRNSCFSPAALSAQRLRGSELSPKPDLLASPVTVRISSLPP